MFEPPWPSRRYAAKSVKRTGRRAPDRHLLGGVDDRLSFIAHTDQRVVASERFPHCLRSLLPESGTPLDIGEEERRRPARQSGYLFLRSDELPNDGTG
jgi:hypothetical protein